MAGVDFSVNKITFRQNISLSLKAIQVSPLVTHKHSHCHVLFSIITLDMHECVGLDIFYPKYVFYDVLTPVCLPYGFVVVGGDNAKQGMSKTNGNMCDNCPYHNILNS